MSAGLEERFLEQLRRTQIPATFYLINGYQLKGHLHDFDRHSLLVVSGDEQRLIFAHAVSTVLPQLPLSVE